MIFTYDRIYAKKRGGVIIMDSNASSKIVSIIPYIENDPLDREKLIQQRTLQILERAFEIMLEGCRLNARDSSFYKKISDYGDKPIFYVNISPNRDERYKQSGSVNGSATYFSIDGKNIKGNIYLYNHNGMTKYAVFGLQKFKETKNKTSYYQILDGTIVSIIKCKKENSFLEELDNVESIEPFSPQIIKKYKIAKKGNN